MGRKRYFSNAFTPGATALASIHLVGGSGEHHVDVFPRFEQFSYLFVGRGEERF
jgi:hypothetical protein